MDKVSLYLVTALLCAGFQVPVTSLKEFSLARFSDTLVYANNSVIDIDLVGEGFEGDQITDGGALECHTDDTNCCRSTDGMAGGEWYYPNGSVIIAANQIGDDNGLYRTRDHMVIRLNRRGSGGFPFGVYRCEIPGAGGVTITRYITLTFQDGLCADLHPLTNGDITYTPPRELSGVLPDGHRYQGTIATYSCSSGHQLVGGSTQRACGGGTWNGTQPFCELACNVSEITNPGNGQVIIEGNTAIYTCDTGYRLNGTSTRTCKSTGRWTNGPPTCPIVDCGPLTAPTNGQVDTSETIFESTATYTCDIGYTLVGLTSRTCESTGRWSSNAPRCQINDCGSLTAPANGQVDTSSGTTFGSAATYACNVVTRTCGPNGSWSALEEPKCSRIPFPTQPTSTDVTTQSATCINTQSTTSDGNAQSTDPTTHGSDVISDCSEISGIVGGVIAVILFLISALLVMCNLHLRRQLKEHSRGQQRSAAQYETVGGGSAPGYEVMEGGDAEYEEIDKVKEKMGQSHPPKGDYELSQCAAYGPINTGTD